MQHTHVLNSAGRGFGLHNPPLIINMNTMPCRHGFAQIPSALPRRPICGVKESNQCCSFDGRVPHHIRVCRRSTHVTVITARHMRHYHKHQWRTHTKLREIIQKKYICNITNSVTQKLMTNSDCMAAQAQIAKQTYTTYAHPHVMHAHV